MLIIILSFLHNTTTLLFGVYSSAAILGIKMNRRNIWTLLCLSGLLGAFSLLSFILSGEHMTEQLYPLIIHLPLILFLTCFYKYKAALSTLSVLTAYLCCQISNWVGIAAFNLAQMSWVYYVVRIVMTVFVLIMVIGFISDTTAQLLQKPTKAIMILSLMPIVYYCFDYVTSVYTELLYSGLEVVVEFLGFVLCLSYLLFLLIYFKQYEEKREAERRNQMIQMQQAQSKKEVEAMRRSRHAVSLLRHDMRHFLCSISALIEQGEHEKAQAYINEIITDTDKTAMEQYSQNEIVNMILSSFENKIQKNEIDFQYTLQLPQQLPVSDVDLTSILSNGLENALQAVLPLEKSKRRILLDMRMKEDKLLISVKNTFAEHPIFADGLPRTTKPGHGFGTQSIQYVTEKLKGHCQFTLLDDMFVLRVIL